MVYRAPEYSSADELEPVSYASLLPISQPAPACQAAAYPLGQHLTRDAQLQNEVDAGQGCMVGQAGRTALQVQRRWRQQRLLHRPERIKDQGSAHAKQNVPDLVLLGAFRTKPGRWLWPSFTFFEPHCQLHHRQADSLNAPQ